MKNRLVEILTLILLCLTGLGGVLTMPDIGVLPESWLKYVPLGLIVVLALKNAIYVFLDWWDDGVVNGSYKIPKHVPLLLLAGLCLLLMPCCATRPDGTKTFGGLDARQWKGVGVETGSAWLDEYRRPVLVTNAKGVLVVEPEPVKAQGTGWLGWGMSLLGL
ncbi:hypothetical protein WJU23_05230 [Prosthecobacter sp. SYSU 5D2]|uniref:hypothetical protein n=1 Tax=Prosthecobacter sp. SYSU 5D2 TaxID=3134134 RepID=UPI0031FF43B1